MWTTTDRTRRPYRRRSPSVQISPGFCLLTAWFAACCGWRPLALVLGASAVHEAGHLLALRLWGAKVSRLRVGICGAVLDTDSQRLSYGRELACVLAGPAANLLLAAVSSAMGAVTLCGVNLTLCALNLLPVRPLDGGRALELAVSWGLGPSAGEAAARLCGAVCATAITALLGAFLWHSGGNLWLLPAAGGFARAAFREWLGRETA